MRASSHVLTSEAMCPLCRLGYHTYPTTSASAHRELGLAWQRQQGTKYKVCPHGDLSPG